MLVSGGSAANLTALACAREAVPGGDARRAVVYVSDQAHSSIARAARMLGFRPTSCGSCPSSDQRMRPDALVGAIAADAGRGRSRWSRCAAAGSTNTGAVDPLPELAEVCRDTASGCTSTPPTGASRR